MKDDDCVEFLQWCLPQLRMRWPGFRKVRRQVCKRVDRRIAELGLPDVDSYRKFLEDNDGEWATLDSLSRVTISRFYRDRGVFDGLRSRVLPVVAKAAQARGESRVRCWNAGCASGEEPYTLQIIWRLETSRSAGVNLPLEVIATDADEELLGRARAGRYRRSSLKDLPDEFREKAFSARGSEFTVLESIKRGVTFLRQDVRTEAPDGVFDVVMCRNLAFTYFEDELQMAVLDRIEKRLVPGGFLIVGVHETPPVERPSPARWERFGTVPGVYVVSGVARGGAA